jgi:hypothetical protein
MGGYGMGGNGYASPQLQKQNAALKAEAFSAVGASAGVPATAAASTRCQCASLRAQLAEAEAARDAALTRERELRNGGEGRDDEVEAELLAQARNPTPASPRS